MDSVSPLPRGRYQDRLLRADGGVTELPWRQNLVVDRCRALLCGFMGGASVLGIRALHVGRGLAAWDVSGAPRPQPGDSALVDGSPVELTLDPGDLVFLDAGGNPVAGPTPRLQVTVELPPGTPPPPGGESSYPLREFALFGEMDGAACMINYVRHPVLHKLGGDTLVRTIRLEF